MSRPRKPAALKNGNSETKEHLDERAELEEEIKGSDDLVYSQIPGSLDEIGVEYYKFIIGEYRSAKLLANLDIPIVTQIANCLSKMDQADMVLNEDGLSISVMDRNGKYSPKEHPMVNTKLKYLKEFRALCTQIGMSPSSRAQLSELKFDDKEKEEDPLLKILNKKD